MRKKRFRNIVFLFIVIVLLLAWFTRPGREDFMEYYNASLVNPGTPPVVEETNGFVYSMFNVSYFNIQPVEEGTVKAVEGRKEKYLGLFGKFWKMD